MTRFSQLMQSCALALCLPAGAAFADLTAAEVWTDWEELMTGSGYTLDSTQSSTDTSVTVSDLSITLDMSDDTDDGAVSMNLGTLRFVENGDGTVTIEIPDTVAVDFSFTSELDESVAGTITTLFTDQLLIASGEPSAVTYSFSAANTDVSLNDLLVDGTPIGEEAAQASMSLDNMSYVTKTIVGDLRQIDQTASIAAASYTLNFAEPTGAESFKMNGTVRDIAFTGGGSLPLDIDTDDANAMLNAGMEFAGNVTTQGGGYDLTFDGPDGSGTINTTSEGAGFDIRFAPSGVAYGVSQRGVAVNMLLTELPLPISVSANEMATNFLFPLQKSDDDQDFSMGVTLTGVTVSDAIWGIFDPTGQLPRTPANLLVDLSGTAKVMFDFLDPAQANILAETERAPGEVQTLDLNALELDAAGASLTGQGNFRFDNSDLETFDGFPRPEGAVDLTLTGGNTLIDTLVGMGLLPQEQAMGARMMMGLFAVPGEGADTLNSRIEVTPEGHVVANGQRLR
ncbi:DUF2125 domain-containing protein [Tateyamaria pelophila]|uniref:DUF2125 domain-containing protein n=1 Tax=Tateyamaria pelophila TaxID=328415 RepID=UPI001CC156EE|nr:DUF2125 domain-containing protein [Tateyamaria pelophila]